ncbi:MAG: o-succinylbenzoate synthase [Acidobacteria bacterium]|nr:o-succinylbenzoate synthase [Acidobacteriota bacterium]
MSSISLHWVQVPLHEPFRISSGAVAVKIAILVEYRNGVTGWGEASPMAGAFYSAETPESTWRALERMAPAVLRDDATDVDRLVEGEPFAKAGLSGALVDREIRARGIPLWQWLGSEPRPVPSGVAIGLYDTVEELLERVERFVAQGYRRVKIKIQPGWDVEPVRRIREKFPHLPLMTDANAAYALRHLDIFRELDRFGLMMFEQPFGRHDLEGMAELARAVRTPVCADESAESMAMLERILALGSASIVNIKIQRVGGIRNAKRMHDRAQQAGLRCWVGTMPELGVASAEAIHLATLPNFVYPTDVESSSRWYSGDIVEPAIAIDGAGFLRAGAIEVNREKLEKYRMRRADFE